MKHLNVVSFIRQRSGLNISPAMLNKRSTGAEDAETLKDMLCYNS